MLDTRPYTLVVLGLMALGCGARAGGPLAGRSTGWGEAGGLCSPGSACRTGLWHNSVCNSYTRRRPTIGRPGCNGEIRE
jgi:hypothetical protein